MSSPRLPESRSKSIARLLSFEAGLVSLFYDKTAIRLKRSTLESFVYFGDQPQLFVDTIIKKRIDRSPRRLYT